MVPETIRPGVMAIAALLAPALLHAAPPDVKHLFPAGGQRGTTVELTVGGSLGKGTSGWCSRPEVTIEIPDKGDKPRIVLPEDAPPGLCWLRFYNDDGASALRPFFIGTLPEVLEVEPNDSLEQAQPVELPVVVNGALAKAGDVDTLAVRLEAGQTLVASMEANRRLGSPVDGVLQLLSPGGFVLEQNDDDRGFDPQIVFTADSGGTYFVRAFGFPATPTSAVRLAGSADFIYRLTLTTGPFADHAVPLGLSRGTSGTARAVGWNLGDEEFLSLPVSAGTDAGPWDEAVLHDPRLPDAVSLKVVPHAVAVEAQPNGPAHPQPVGLPVSITGCIEEPRDIDEYRFSAAKGDKLHFRVEARSLGAPLDPVLRLLDADGKVLQEVDDSTRGVFDCELTFTAPADGEYAIQVFDLHRHGGFRYVYLLTAGYAVPDFSLTVAANAFKAQPGKPLEIPVTVARANGFDGEVEITAAGLPEGVTAAPAVSQPKGDTAKTVKLVIESAGESGFNGPFRISGRGAAESELVRHAEAPIGDLATRTTELWLTVPGAPAAKAKSD